MCVTRRGRPWLSTTTAAAGRADATQRATQAMGETYLGEGALGEDDQQTRLTAGSVTDDDELATDLGHAGGLMGL
jgi:hypothetical protein